MANALASWNEGPVKTAILDFLARVTGEGGPDFVPERERVAVFDNDGTLWCEYPMQVQVFHGIADIAAIAGAHPEKLDDPVFKALATHDQGALRGMAKKDVFATLLALHAGEPVEESMAGYRDWLATARHPSLGRRFVQGGFRPQRELLDLLRAHGFSTWIVTGGGVNFVRTVAGSLYGVPPEQVIGSSVRLGLADADDAPVPVQLAQLGSFNDRGEKVANIVLHIGRRPIFAFGNSDGDLAMLRYTLAGKGPGMAWYLHHDDGEREFAYDRDFRLSPFREGLDRAREYGIGLVSMKRDWRRVFDDAAMATAA